MNDRNEAASGLVFGVAATLLWGSYPLWYKPLASLNSYHLLSWRIVFAELFLVGFIVFTNRWKVFHSTLKTIRPRNVLIVAGILGAWWLTYIYGIVTGRVLEVAFGYFLSPIMSMFVSRLLFKEQLSRHQSIAIILAVVGVVMMAIQLLSLQSFPWIAIIIGFCYSFYGVFKKRVPGDPIIVQSLEILTLLPFAAVFLIIASAYNEGHAFLQSGATDLLLVATGLIAVLPLWWYSQAAKRLSVITLSFLQFVPPTCNFVLAVFVYHEAVSSFKTTAFVLIWGALAVFVWDGLRKQKKPVVNTPAAIDISKSA